MSKDRAIHPDFHHFLDFKSSEIINQYHELRAVILEKYPDSNELLYNTHALSTAFSISEKLRDTYCMIVIYTNHVNLTFNKGAYLDDPDSVLQGTGKHMRHIAASDLLQYKNNEWQEMITKAYELAEDGMNKPSKVRGESISKIKKK